ncbi:Tho complex subunit 7-domain-containing protein [Clohesyomyces aquaticus]|uniref:Tho complex subunit 7-domain-containing protein n=1 Tax=Clohesyomyces aquaticus TaxID=1231657 RepID=A0A1Y2A0N5_9PLEO|nr:Tho complex subunit 7-domain-containing protein [Clohesyomyces aquaticus]
MVTHDWSLLSQADEDALHTISRLLSVESRPCFRIANQLFNKERGLVVDRPLQLPSPPPDASAADEAAAAKVAEAEAQNNKVDLWRQEIINEVDMLDYSMVRMEWTTQANQAERDRYARDKAANEAKQAAIRDSIEELREQLKEAKETLAIRKTYDDQTEKITSSKMLKPRDEQAAAHAKLDEEIAELQQEVENSKQTWLERRMQFFRIEEEAKEMLRMIKDEKEEAERKEGMMKDGDEGEDGEAGSRGDVSHIGTPRPDGGATPMQISHGDDGSHLLKVPQDRLAPLSRGGSVAPSPAKPADQDVEMSVEEVLDRDAGGDDSSVEEGEHEEDDGPPPDETDDSSMR